MTGHDSGYKLLFSHPRMVEALLRAFVREEWVGQLDFTTLERISGSFVSGDLKDRHNDVVWRLRRKGGEGPVYLLLEFQSSPYRFMAVRLLTYLSLLWEDRIRNKELNPGRKLPPVLLVVVYNGKRPWSPPCELDGLTEPLEGCLGEACPHFRYLVVDEWRVDPQDIEKISPLMAAVIRVERAVSPEEILRVAASLSKSLPREEPELRRAFTVWLLQGLRRIHPGMKVPELGDLKEMTGLEANGREWRREVEAKVVRNTLLRLMKRRFGPLPVQVNRKLAEIHSVRRLQELTEEVLTARSPREMGLE